MKFSSLFKKESPAQRIYLDYAAATPVHPDVFSLMQPYFTEKFGNASAIHKEGGESREAIECARENIARLLHIRPQGVVFTSGGTESNHLGVLGIVEALHHAGRAYSEMRIVTTRIEHPSLLGICDMLQARGVEIAYVAVDEEGVIDEKQFAHALTEQTVLVTYAYANSEVGTVQPVKRLSRVIKKFNAEHHTTIYTHLDASQAPLWLPCQLDQLDVDLMTLDAGKCYGPKGIGVLAFRHGVKLRSPFVGGKQESGLRAGTENVPGIVGCAAALVRAQESWEREQARVVALRDECIRELMALQGAVLNGSAHARIANNINVSFPGLDSEFLVIWLDTKGIACSTRSACSGGEKSASHVVFEMTRDAQRANATLRCTLGLETTREELQIFMGRIRTFFEKIRTHQNEH